MYYKVELLNPYRQANPDDTYLLDGPGGSFRNQGAYIAALVKDAKRAVGWWRPVTVETTGGTCIRLRLHWTLSKLIQWRQRRLGDYSAWASETVRITPHDGYARDFSGVDLRAPR